MTHAENQHDQAIVFDPDDEAVVAHTIFPELTQSGPMQRFPDGARIIEPGEALAKELYDPFAFRGVELAEFPDGRLGQFNVPSHGASMRL